MAEKSIKAVAKRPAPEPVEADEPDEVDSDGGEVEAAAEPAAERAPSGRSWAQGGLPRQNSRDAERSMRLNPDVLCRSCGKRPGRPTAIIGQLTATELCEVCANLRKERIRANRASQRGYRL